MQQFVKFVRHFFNKKSRHTFMTITSHFYGLCGSAGMWNCSAFCQTHRNSAHLPHFHDKRCRNPSFTRRCALRHGHQSAAPLVGEKWHECRHVFKCHCGAFVAFFLMRTVAITGLEIHFFSYVPIGQVIPNFGCPC